MATLLVVEDEPEVRQIVAECLADAGHTVLEADCCAAALAMLAANPVDLLLTDIRMPDGLGTTLATGAAALYPALRILLMTGYQPNGFHWPLLRKPFHMRELRDAVVRALVA